jgi:hypothetical protein
MIDFGDDELRTLVEGCPSLCSLRLSFLDDITEGSVMMLRNHRPRVPSVCIQDCEGVSWESVLSLLRETTIPTICSNDEDEKLQINSIDDLYFATELASGVVIPGIADLFLHNSLLERFISLMAHSTYPVRFLSLEMLRRMASRGHDRRMIDAGVVPVLVRLFDSFDEQEKDYSLSLLASLSSHPNHLHDILSSGVLSMFRPQLEVRLCLTRFELLLSLITLSQVSYDTARVLLPLSSLVPQSVVPIEDWISTVSFLIAGCFKDFPGNAFLLHQVIHSICMACTSPSHVRSLVDEGILGYWEKALVSRRGDCVVGSDVLVEAISHLFRFVTNFEFSNDLTPRVK